MKRIDGPVHRRPHYLHLTYVGSFAHDNVHMHDMVDVYLTDHGNGYVADNNGNTGPFELDPRKWKGPTRLGACELINEYRGHQARLREGAEVAAAVEGIDGQG